MGLGLNKSLTFPLNWEDQMSWGKKKIAEEMEINKEDGTPIGIWRHKSRDGKWTQGQR